MNPSTTDREHCHEEDDQLDRDHATSASSLVTIFCDAPSCGQWDEYGVGWTAAEARRNLRGTKWQLNVPNPDGGGQRLDFCPAHATTPSPSRPVSSDPPGGTA